MLSNEGSGRDHSKTSSCDFSAVEENQVKFKS